MAANLIARFVLCTEVVFNEQLSLYFRRAGAGRGAQQRVRRPRMAALRERVLQRAGAVGILGGGVGAGLR